MRVKGSDLQARLQALRHHDEGVVVKTHVALYENEDLEVTGRKNQEYVDLDGDGKIDLLRQTYDSVSEDGTMVRANEKLVERVDANNFYEFHGIIEDGRLNRDFYEDYNFDKGEAHRNTFIDYKQGDIRFDPTTKGLAESSDTFDLDFLHGSFNKQMDQTPIEQLFLEKFGCFFGQELTSLGAEEGDLFARLESGQADPERFGQGRIQEVSGYDSSGSGKVDVVEVKIYHNGRRVKQFTMRDRNEDGKVDESRFIKSGMG